LKIFIEYFVYGDIFLSNRVRRLQLKLHANRVRRLQLKLHVYILVSLFKGKIIILLLVWQCSYCMMS